MIRALPAVVAAALSLAVATSALGRPQTAPDHFGLRTRDVAVPAATKPKPAPICKKGQRSTKKHPCRKRKTQAAAVRANPPAAGWKFSLSLASNPDGSWGLQLLYAHAAGNAREFHSYSFNLSPDSATVAPDLSSFTLNTGSQLGQFGAISMSLSNPGALQPLTPPAGCTSGTWQTRAGVLTGMLRFVADGSYFKVLTESSLPVDLNAQTSGTPVTCGTPPVTCTHSTLIFGGNATSGNGSFYASLQNGSVTITRFTSQKVDPATLTHLLTVSGLPASDLTVASDLSTGTLTTTGAGPWLTGSVTVKVGGPASSFQNASCGWTSSFAQGTSSGDFTAHFAAIPALALDPGTGYLELF